MTNLFLPVSYGEAADKLSILEIKKARISDPDKLVNVEREWALIADILNKIVCHAASFPALYERLKSINQRLWDIEDSIREHETRQDFGAEFVRLARAVYVTNDERSRAKRAIDELFDSPIREEKSYAGSSRAESIS